MISNQDDDNQNFALGLIAAIVLAVVAFAVGMGIYKSHGSKKADAKAATAAVAMPAAVGTGTAAAASASAAEATAAAAAAPSADAASVAVDLGVVKFFFASGKTDVAMNAVLSLVDVVSATKTGKKAVVSGFADARGDPVKNAELAKLRAFAVRDALKAAGVPEAQIELRKPQATTGNATGSSADARRVDVRVE